MPNLRRGGWSVQDGQWRKQCYVYLTTEEDVQAAEELGLTDRTGVFWSRPAPILTEDEGERVQEAINNRANQIRTYNKRSYGSTERGGIP